MAKKIAEERAVEAAEMDNATWRAEAKLNGTEQNVTYADLWSIEEDRVLREMNSSVQDVRAERVRRATEVKKTVKLVRQHLESSKCWRALARVWYVHVCTVLQVGRLIAR